jgi:hypothetical protein
MKLLLELLLVPGNGILCFRHEMKARHQSLKEKERKSGVSFQWTGAADFAKMLSVPISSYL